MIDYVGKQLGNYRLARLLGDGGFAQVYLGEHIYLANKSVAIKVLKGSFTEEHVELFRTEAQTIHNLQHPHIVQVMDFGVTTIDGHVIPFLVMDYAPHGSLLKLRPSGGVLPLTAVLFYLKPLVSALQYAHDQQVVHRDIKPANLLIGKDGQVLLSDFGIAVTAHATSSMIVQDISGTPAYMAPEQFDGKSRPASDQYALGVILYEWLCGEKPFSGPTFPLYALQHKTVPPTSLIRMGAAISPSIDKIILKALEKDPKQRFARVQDLADALEQEVYHTSEYVSGYRPVINPTSKSVASEESKIAQKMVKTPTRKDGTNLRPGALAKLAGIILLIALAVSTIFTVNTVQENNANATATTVQENNVTATAFQVNNAFSVPQNWKVALHDPLSDNIKGYQWAENSDNTDSSCQFAKGTYQAIDKSKKYFYSCGASAPSFANFALQVDMKLDQGDCGGITFREDLVVNNFYYFKLCQGGYYTLYLFNSNYSSSGILLEEGYFPGNIDTGQWNTIKVLANQDTIKAYINSFIALDANDHTFTSGSIALTADNTSSTQTITEYRNIEVWTP